MENVCYVCICDILQDLTQPRKESARLHQLKAKIIVRKNKQLQAMTCDARDSTMCQGQNPSLFHVIQRRKRRDARMIVEIQDENENLQTTARVIQNTFVGI